MGRSKKILRVFLPGVALLSFAACSGNPGQSASSNAGAAAPGLVPAANFLDGVSHAKKKTLKGLYVASNAGNDVDIYSEAKAGGLIGSLSGPFSAPQGIYINPSGTVYIGDTNNDRILVYANGSTTNPQTMFTQISRAGSCAECHSDPPNYNALGHIYMSATGSPYLGEQSCPADPNLADFATGGLP